LANNIFNFATEIKEWLTKWQTLSIYEKFEQTIVTVLELVIATIATVATWQLVLHTIQLAAGHLVNVGDLEVFQSLFGMIFNVLIALEFKHTLMVVRHQSHAIIQVRAVVLIALLALVRRFISLDLYRTTPGEIAALAGAALALGIVYWLVSPHREPQKVEIHD
jgi:uncharacterized membrane protein (DUF373 family)